MSGAFQFVDVILPLPLPQLFTYKIPLMLSQEVFPGKRAVVQFGKKKIYTAIIKQMHNNEPKEYETKEIISVLDKEPIVNQTQLKFWEWLAEYYSCTIGEVYKAALPSGLKLESETKVFYSPEFSDFSSLSNKEELLITILKEKNVLSINEVNSLLKQANSLPVIKSLLDKNAIIVEEKLKDSYKPKYENYVKLGDEYDNEEKLKEVFDQLGRAPKQLNLLMTYLHLSSQLQDTPTLKILKSELLAKANASQSIFKGLQEKNIFSVYQEEVGRLENSTEAPSIAHELNDHQVKAFQQIKESFQEKDVTLLHGVTSSGKTEVYIHLIQEYIDKGKQVLYLLPEIALTAQIINRLKNVFGNKVGIYHSKFSDSERVEIWNNIISDKEDRYQIILGVRSSVFLPFNNLGLIIIDEEHENTYKQFDPAPRYNARDAAIVLSKYHDARVLMGTATPAVESYFNAKIGKYALVELTQRYQNIKMPEILVADTKKAQKRRQMKSHFTPLLIENIEEALKNGEQIILFQNRRGFSPYVECTTCGWVPKCTQCDVSLTYHKHQNKLVCHYCGFVYNNHKVCQACASPTLQTKGFGTEKIEDEIAIFFPDIKVARMDLDTTRSRKSYERLISDFETKKVDILVGTQMVSKGLDFDNVSIVGVLNADNMLNFPDFRAFERSYQLMTQVSGRAGRKNKQGKVIIQTSTPDHPIVKDVIANNYGNMYLTQLSERKSFNYPPFVRLIKLTIKHKDKNITNAAAQQLANDLKKIFGKRVMGPEEPIINRIQNWYIKGIMLKVERKASVLRAKKILLSTIGNLKTNDNFKSAQVIVDVDPM